VQLEQLEQLGQLGQQGQLEQLPPGFERLGMVVLEVFLCI